MASVRTTPQEARGDGTVTLKGGFIGNGSTAAGVGPMIPLAPIGGVTQPRWAGYMVFHDSSTGLYDVWQDDDWVDETIHLSAQSNDKWYPGYVLIPVSTTTGDGIVLVNLTPNSLPLSVVVTISGGTATVGSWVNSSGILTLTCGSTCPIATAVAYINSHNTTTTTTTWKAYGVGTLTDVMTGSAITVGLNTGPNTNGIGVSNASVSIGSTTAGSGITFTANTPGVAGNFTIVFSADTTLAITSVEGGLINVALDTTGSNNTNQKIASLFNATAATQALVTPTVYGTASDQMLAATGVAVAGTIAATLVGAVTPNANHLNGFTIPVTDQPNTPINSVGFVHFKILTTEGGVAVDRGARATLFIPSTTFGDGVLIASGAIAPVAASTIVASTTTTCGVSFTAKNAGDSGNNIAVVFQGPYASLLMPSTTGGDGIAFTAVAIGSLGTAISVFCAAPNGPTSTCSVSGNAISLYPKTGETTGGLITVIQASVPASALVSVAYQGSNTDTISTAGMKTTLLSGGNSLATAAVSVFVNNSVGINAASVITVQFGLNATNAGVTTAVNTANSPSAALVTAANVSTNTDYVVATAMQFLGTTSSLFTGTGTSAVGFQPADITVHVAGPVTTKTTAAFTLPTSSTIATITVASTVGSLNPGAVTGAFSFVGTDGVLYHATSTGSSSTTFTASTPTAYPSVAQTIPVGTVIFSDIPYASVSGNALTLNLGNLSTNNTNAKVAATIVQSNSTATPLVLAAAQGSTTDVIPIATVLQATPMVCNDLVLWTIDARKATSGPY
jgi:hypothetical protein